MFTNFGANSRHSQLSTVVTMASEPPKKFRRPRFTDTEALTLVEEVERRCPVIMGRLDNTVTADKKNRAWEEVTAAVNEVSRVGRTLEELRRKFKDLRSHVKIKSAAELRHIAGTGKFFGFAYHVFVSIVADLALSAADRAK